MKPSSLTALAVAILMLPAVSAQAQRNPDSWTLDLSFYGLAAGMSGDVTVRGVTSDLDMGFDDVVENLEFGAMGRIRAGRGKWAVTTDVIYMGLGASKGPVSGDLDQWVVEPSLSYRASRYIELLAGARYNSLDGEIRGPLGRNPTGTQDWWDPIVGALGTLPLSQTFSLNVRGDVGGFNVGSDLTWQAFPYVSWQVAKRTSIQAGYRWVYTDYHSGSGANEFGYDVLTQGPQLGLTLHF